MEITYQDPSGAASIRVIEHEGVRYVWAPDRPSVDVPADLAFNLLTYPHPGFCASGSEPLLGLVGVRLEDGTLIPPGPAGEKLLAELQAQGQRFLAGMAMVGIGSLAELAVLTPNEYPILAEAAGADEAAVAGWVAQAKTLIGGGED